MKMRLKAKGIGFLLASSLAAAALLLLVVAVAEGHTPELSPPTPRAARFFPPSSSSQGDLQGASVAVSDPTGYAAPRSWRPASPTDGPPVLVIQDSYAWNSSGIQELLALHSIPYDEVNSSVISTIDLSPYALVIIPSVQGSSYYTTYNSNLAKFEAYVAGGGVLELHGATQISHVPYPIPPGGITNLYDSDGTNYLVEPAHPLASGVPNPFYGGSASHNVFTNTIPGTIVICTRGGAPGGEPTLIEYPYGAGWVIASGQTLEYGYRYGQGAGRVLRNLIPYAYSKALGGFMSLVPDEMGGGPFGTVVSHTVTLHNYTGITATFDLTTTAGGWPVAFWQGEQITRTNPVPYGRSIDLTARVSIPGTASPGDVDATTVQATSVTLPNAYTRTATISTTAVCSPALVFEGNSAQALGLVDSYEYGAQRFTLARLRAHTASTRNSMNAAVEGYQSIQGTWETLAEWTEVGPDQLLLNLVAVPPVHSGVRVQLNDTRNHLAHYDYRFIVCREPAVDVDVQGGGRLAQAGSTAVFTPTVTNCMMADESFDLSIVGNSWPTTFWDGPVAISSTPPLADLETFTFTVRVEVPPAAGSGDVDEPEIRTQATASPAVTDRATLRTVVLAHPWVQAFQERWAPDESTDPEQYLTIVPRAGVVDVQMTSGGESEHSPPAVPAYPRGALVSAWSSASRSNGMATYRNIEYVAHDAHGNAVVPVTQVSDNVGVTTNTYDDGPALAVDPLNGTVLIAWCREKAPSAKNVYYAVRGPSGSEILPPTALTTNTTSSVQDTQVSAAAFGDGGYAIVWRRCPGGPYDIMYAVLDGTGDLTAGPSNLTQNTWESDHEPRVNRLADGNVLLTWHGYHSSGSELYYAVVDQEGNVAHPVTQLTSWFHNSYRPDAVGLHNGGAVIAWEQVGNYPGRGQQVAHTLLNDVYYTATLPVAGPSILTNMLSNWNINVSLTSDVDDNAVLTWSDSNHDRIYYGLVDNTGAVQAWPMVFRKARGSVLALSAAGSGCGSLPLGLWQIHLPTVMRMQ